MPCESLRPISSERRISLEGDGRYDFARPPGKHGQPFPGGSNWDVKCQSHWVMSHSQSTKRFKNNKQFIMDNFKREIVQNPSKSKFFCFKKAFRNPVLAPSTCSPAKLSRFSPTRIDALASWPHGCHMAGGNVYQEAFQDLSQSLPRFSKEEIITDGHHLGRSCDRCWPNTSTLPLLQQLDACPVGGVLDKHLVATLETWGNENLKVLRLARMPNLGSQPWNGRMKNGQFLSVLARALRDFWVKLFLKPASRIRVGRPQRIVQTLDFPKKSKSGHDACCHLDIRPFPKREAKRSSALHSLFKKICSTTPNLHPLQTPAMRSVAWNAMVSRISFCSKRRVATSLDIAPG